MGGVKIVGGPLEDMMRAMMGGDIPAPRESEKQRLIEAIKLSGCIFTRETRRNQMRLEMLELLGKHPAVARYIELREKVQDEHLLEPPVDGSDAGTGASIHDPEDCGDPDCPVHGAANTIRG